MSQATPASRRRAPHPSGAPAGQVRFAHPSERLFAALLDLYEVRWEYEPVEFVLAWGPDGQPTSAFAKAQLQVARNGVGLGDVIEGHHHDAEKEHRRNRADPVPVRGQDAVLVRGTSPSHQLQRAKVGGDEA